MSNLAKYKTTLDEHVKLSQQLLGLGADPVIEAAPEPEKTASAADIGGLDDSALLAKLAESAEGQALVTKWTAYGEHLGNVKFAEDVKSEELAKVAEQGLEKFLVDSVGQAGTTKIAQAYAAGTDPISAFLDVRV